MDVFTPEKRSEVMSRIRGRDTKPELALRSMLHRLGYRFTVNGPNNRSLPGKPDLVLPKYHTVIFVHGCFWHGHENCPSFRMPKSRIDFWTAKIARQPGPRPPKRKYPPRPRLARRHHLGMRVENLGGQNLASRQNAATAWLTAGPIKGRAGRREPPLPPSTAGLVPEPEAIRQPFCVGHTESVDSRGKKCNPGGYLITRSSWQPFDDGLTTSSDRSSAY